MTFNPSTSGSLHLTLENGAKVRGFAVTPEGDVLFMDAQGVMRQMHPMVVEAMATQHVPSGIFAVAVMKKKTANAEIRQMGKTSLGLVDK
jgi:hypothetical protein